MLVTTESGQRPRRREHLLSSWHLAVFAAALLVVLCMLAPTPAMLENSLARPDSLSVQYLRLLVAMRPHDANLRLHLAQALFSLNRLDEAGQLLESLPMDAAQLRLRVRRLALQIQIARFTRDPEQAVRDPQLKLRLMQGIEELIAESLPPEELGRLAATSLAIGRPALAARIYLRLADVDRPRRSAWLDEAARQLYASGEPAGAGRLYDLLAEGAADPREGRRYALLALAAFTGADQSDKALACANRYVARFPHDAEVLKSAARLALANGQPAVAGSYYDQLVAVTRDSAEQRRYAKLALSVLTAANRADTAVLTAGRFLALFPGDRELRRAAIKLALANNQLRLSQEWGRILLQQEPDNHALLAEQLNLELAVGDAAAALELARRLVEQRPTSVRSRERLAELAEWNGQPHLALTQWSYLALRTPNQRYLERALQMAPQLYEMEILAELLIAKSKRGRLTNPELASLTDTLDNIGEPEKLVQVLNSYLERHSEHREAWEALSEVHERRGDLALAVATLERVSREFGSTLKLLTRRAELMWQLQRPGEAYLLLRDALGHAGVATTQPLLASAELAAAEPSSKRQAAGGERQEFFELLAQLLWHSEPRPETLDDYRMLWREGVLLRDSVDRYIRLARAKGLNDEAISVAETAFVRFQDPEFLLWAIDLAQSTERRERMERLIEATRQYPDAFANNKHYYMSLGEYYTRQGEYERAQLCYLKVIYIDPGTVAARAAVLWLLIDHSNDLDRLAGKKNRLALSRFLTQWRDLAKDEPSLWLPFATGWAMLGASRDAEAFYKREWTRRPAEHLWLLGYITTLDAVSRSSDARQLRRFALRQLRPEALTAAHRNASQAEREVLRAYVELVRDTYGPGKGLRWLAQVLGSDLDPEVRKGLAATWRGGEASGEENAWILSSRTLSAKNPWGRFPKASRPRKGQATLTDAGSIPDETAEPAPEPLSVLESDAAAGEDKVPANAQLVAIETGVQSVNDLLTWNTSVSALVARGAFGVGGRVGVNQLFIGDGDDPQASTTEVDLSAHVMWRHRLGRLEAGLGANLRPDANLLYGWISESFSLFRGGSLQLGAHLNEVTYDTRWLRLYGARHRVTLNWNASFFKDGFIGVQGNFYHYHTRTNEEIGAGVNADIDIGYRIRRVRPLWTLRMSAGWTRNFHLTDRLPEFGGQSGSGQSLLDALPVEFAALGIGSRVEHRFPGAAPLGAGRWRYMGDVWVGWLWPINIPGFEMRAGATLGLPRKQELSLSGFVANNRWLGPGVINAGLSLRYSFR